MPLVDLGDIRLHYTLDGPADAPVLVLAHGLGLALDMWDAQMPEFRRRSRVLRYDARGHGLSSIPAHDAAIDELAANRDADLRNLQCRHAAA